MQIAPTECLTTVAYDRPPTFLMTEIYAPSKLLYFRFVLRFEGEIFDFEQRARLQNCLGAAIEMFGGKSKAVGFADNSIHLLIGLPPQTILEDFVERLRIFSKSVAQRRLNAKRFVWNKKYQISTVSFSQIETVSRDIRRKDRAMPLALLCQAKTCRVHFE